MGSKDFEPRQCWNSACEEEDGCDLRKVRCVSVEVSASGRLCGRQWATIWWRVNIEVQGPERLRGSLFKEDGRQKLNEGPSGACDIDFVAKQLLESFVCGCSGEEE
jgi:hypothetical protein